MMYFCRKWVYPLLIAVVLVFSSSPMTAVYAGGGGPLTGGALEMTQLENKAQLIKQVSEAVKQTSIQLSQYQNMLTNILKLPSTTWTDVTKDLVRLRNLLDSAESLTYGAAFDHEKFKKRYPGYREEQTTDYDQKYRELVAQWQAYIEAALKANQISAQGIEDDQAFIAKLKAASENSEGQHQALQAGNQIAVFMAQQLTQLRSDMQRQIELQASYASMAQQPAIDEQQALKDALGTWKEPPKSKNYSFF